VPLLKTLQIACVLLLSFFAICGCGENKDHKKNSTIILLTSADNYPFQFYITDGGEQKIAGFDVDLAKAIADKMSMSLEIKDMDFNGLIPALQAKRGDFVMAALAITDDRKENVYFSDVYLETNTAIVTAIGKSLKKDTALKGKRIGVQLGSTYEQILKGIKDKIKDLEIVALNRFGDLIQELRAGRIDGVMTEEAVAKAYVGSNKDIDYNMLSGYQSSFAAAFLKHDSSRDLIKNFNKALKELRDEGAIESIKNKWFVVK
jgi:ABC-type amino acid transport substrate-binding protein